ncbi:hypothetical protein [Alkalimarinus alittae]|uniref:Macroglobulin domain-containing protein n=1 Tax=Alkalimarinus alittae TaxID=2961619 RepID=A0ABY6MYD3_9ALTE|nr:hypothetical protein [Alkalimarinus alittae]UZE94848.1 hypothetical protein NKI27_12245 [Alkalimarinus alittae]
MRILGRSILFLCLILFIGLCYKLWQDLYQHDHLNIATPYPNAVTERNDVYLLSNTKAGSLTADTDIPSSTLSFKIDQRIERLQVSTIALFPIPDNNPEAFNQKNVDIMRQQKQYPRYSIEYTLLDEHNNHLSQNTYWFNAKPSRWVHQHENQQDVNLKEDRIAHSDNENDLVPEIFLSDSSVHAGTRQTIFLRMSHWPTARRLKIRLQHQPAEIAGASIYVRQNFSRSQEEATTLWRKLSESKRTRLTEGVNMYPHYIWTSAEIDALLSNYWQHLGPDGVVDVDFTTLGLYRVTDAQPATVADNSSPSLPASTLVVSKGQNLTFPIHSTGEVQLTYSPLNPNINNQDITLTFHNLDAPTPTIVKQAINPTVSTWQGTIPKGLLEISADQALEIEFQKMPDEESEHHKKHFKRYFLVGPNQPLTYPIEHWQGQATPVQIKTRAIINPSGLSTDINTTTTANWLTDKNTAVNSNSHETPLSHRLSLDYQPSRYERLAGGQLTMNEAEFTNRVSVEKSAYYLAPSSIHTLQITSTSPVLVDVSTRPFKLPLLRNIPDHNRSWFDDESYIPTWFNLRPNDYHTLISQDQSVMLRTQHRPLIDREASLNEQFTSEQIPPDQAQSNLNQILVPESSDEKLSTASPVRRYRQLSPASTQLNQPKKLNFSNTSSHRTLSPSLVYTSENGNPRKIDIALDNQVIHSQWITGKWGKITLPQITKGLRSLAIRGSTEQWFTNQVDFKIGERYLIQKDAYSLTKQQMTYTINKTTADTLLNFTYYRETTNNAIEDTLIEVRLLNTKPNDSAEKKLSNSMTIPIRHWRLAPSSGSGSESKEHGLMLNRGDRKTDTGSHFVYRLGDDLPVGQYQVQFSLLEGSEGYFNVSRLTPIEGVEIDYFRESNDAY